MPLLLGIFPTPWGQEECAMLEEPVKAGMQGRAGPPDKSLQAGEPGFLLFPPPMRFLLQKGGPVHRLQFTREL